MTIYIATDKNETSRFAGDLDCPWGRRPSFVLHWADALLEMFIANLTREPRKRGILQPTFLTLEMFH